MQPYMYRIAGYTAIAAIGSAIGQYAAQFPAKKTLPWAVTSAAISDLIHKDGTSWKHALVDLATSTGLLYAAAKIIKPKISPRALLTITLLGKLTVFVVKFIEKRLVPNDNPSLETCLNTAIDQARNFGAEFAEIEQRNQQGELVCKDILFIQPTTCVSVGRFTYQNGEVIEKKFFNELGKPVSEPIEKLAAYLRKEEEATNANASS